MVNILNNTNEIFENEESKTNLPSSTTELIDEPLQIFNDMNNRFEYDEAITESVNKWLVEHKIEDKLLFETVYTHRDELKYAAFLGFLFSRGIGCKIHEEQAFKYYKMKADNWAAGQFWLGICHYRGIGTAKNADKSFSWFMTAAAQGESRAMDWLGYLYQCGGNSSNLKINKRYAAYWYGKAANLGNRSAQSNFGTCYELGIGLNRDLHEALRWLQRAPEFTQDTVIRILRKYRNLYY
ncbi:4093_t:CDS:2 [Ambispora gerdemannii]|uniref:4093_t:CDS:1 n=1 Tax=Ambispora gerdemannii TaxID=144530 RepID=A0A9N9FB61_9GLOM|nr:4093_t:CDS:2 [Ambispora gerdemannii]